LDLGLSYYPRGIKITDKQLTAVPLRRHDFHGEWNYTVLPEWLFGLRCGRPLSRPSR